MSHYDKYLCRPYIEGRQDCYALVREYFRNEWGISLPNFARPHAFWSDPNLDLYGCYHRFGFELINDEALEVGDVLLVPLATERASHCGVVVEGNQFLHHMVHRMSSLDPVRPRWSSRAVAVLRHPVVRESKETARLHLHEVLNADILRDPRVRQRIEAAVGPEGGAVRGDHPDG